MCSNVPPQSRAELTPSSTCFQLPETEEATVRWCQVTSHNTYRYLMSEEGVEGVEEVEGAGGGPAGGQKHSIV